jgi:CBS domain-containing protein
MLARNVSGLPMVDDQGGLVGIVTEADVIRKQAWGEGERQRHRHRALDLVDRLLSGKEPTSLHRIVGLTAGDIMSRQVVAASPDDDLRQAARTMLVYGVKRLPVVSDGRLVGLMSRADLMRYFDRPDADIAADVERTLANPLSAPEDNRIASMVHDGVVTLTGTVRHPSDAKVAAAAVWPIAGVVDVRDELVARETEPGLDNLHIPLA